MAALNGLEITLTPPRHIVSENVALCGTSVTGELTRPLRLTDLVNPKTCPDCIKVLESAYYEQE